MKCHDVVSLWVSSQGVSERDAQWVAEHLVRCDGCRNAVRALRALHAEAATPVPHVPSGALERALRIATEQPQRRVTYQPRGFWPGVAVGAAVAAAVAIAAVLLLMPVGRDSVSNAVPGVSMALNETRNVSIALDSPVALSDAEIRVVLNGAIELAGFAGQKELTWRADLDAGVNQLTLPVVVVGANGGQLTVEVQHADKRRMFVIDVRSNDPARAGSEAAGV
jgi:hypothetical protein